MPAGTGCAHSAVASDGETELSLPLRLQALPRGRAFPGAGTAYDADAALPPQGRAGRPLGCGLAPPYIPVSTQRPADFQTETRARVPAPPPTAPSPGMRPRALPRGISASAPTSRPHRPHLPTVSP